MPKKILFFCGGSYVYGKEIVTLNVIKELKKRGVEVHCIVNGWNNGDFISHLKVSQIPFDEVKLGFFYLKKPLWTLDSLLHYPKAIYKLKNVIDTFDPDYIYFNSERIMLSAFPVLKNHNLVLHIHDAIINSNLNRFIFNIFKYFNITFIACSNFIKSKILEVVPSACVSTIYNAIDFDERERSLNSKKDYIQVGVVGQLATHKGQDILIRAIAKLKEYNIQCILYGAGNEEYKKELMNLASYYGIVNKIIFKGYVKELEKIYSDLDIVVVPSRCEEAFGLVAIEPAQWRIPVIVSDRGGLPEIVENNVTGLVFESENVNDLTSKLKILVDDASLRASLGNNAFRKAYEKFQLNSLGTAFYKLL